MAAPLTIKIKGINETLASLTKNVDKITKEIDMEMSAGMELMATTAKSIFSADAPEIRASIRSEKIKPFQYSLIAGYGPDPMPAYIEFGTGRYFVQYPGKEAEWQKLAQQYYINGRGWMRPAPYFYPSVTSGIVSMTNNIRQVINRDERL